MDALSTILKPLRVIEGDPHPYTAHWAGLYRPGYLLLVKTASPEHEKIIELITQWVLRGTFYLIAGGEWLPNHDEVRYSFYRHTTAIEETLNHLILARPFTCFQLLDLLLEAGRQNKPVLVLDFLHLFHDADIELPVRERVLAQSCQAVKQLSLSQPVAVLVPTLSTDAYRQFFPVLAAVVDEILEAEEQNETEAIQGLLF